MWGDEPIGCRRLWALVHGLPDDAATFREGSAWTTAHELAAAGIEVADMWGRNLALMAGAKKSSLPKPVRITRPGEEAESSDVMTVSDFATHYRAMAEGGEG